MQQKTLETSPYSSFSIIPHLTFTIIVLFRVLEENSPAQITIFYKEIQASDSSFFQTVVMKFSLLLTVNSYKKQGAIKIFKKIVAMPST